MPNSGEKTIDIITSLAESVNISELSTAEYVYNGIAHLYDEEKTDRLECSMRYEASVKASVDFNQISFDVKEDTKDIIVYLPAIKTKVYLTDKNLIEFIPENYKDIDYGKAREICIDDVEKEIEENDELTILAEENLKNTITALLTPILKGEYDIVWEDKNNDEI